MQHNTTRNSFKRHRVSILIAAAVRCVFPWYVLYSTLCTYCTFGIGILFQDKKLIITRAVTLHYNQGWTNDKFISKSTGNESCSVLPSPGLSDRTILSYPHYDIISPRYPAMLKADYTAEHFAQRLHKSVGVHQYALSCKKTRKMRSIFFPLVK